MTGYIRNTITKIVLLASIATLLMLFLILATQMGLEWYFKIQLEFRSPMVVFGVFMFIMGMVGYSFLWMIEGKVKKKWGKRKP